MKRKFMRKRKPKTARSGLATKLLLEPAHAASLPAEERAWTCWRCGLGLPVLTRYDLEGNKRLHMPTEHGIYDLIRNYMEFSEENPEKWQQETRKGMAASRKRRKLMSATSQSRQEWFPKHRIVELPIDFNAHSRTRRRGKERVCSKCRDAMSFLNRRGMFEC